MTHFRLVVVAIFLCELLITGVAKATVCDRSKEPWLSETCELPSRDNLDHACRTSALLKSQKVAPDSIPESDIYKFPNAEFAYESFEKLSWTTCENIKKLRCSTVFNNLLSNYQIVQSRYIDTSITSRLALATDTQSPPQGDRDANLTRNYESLDAKGQAIVALIRDVSISMQSVLPTVVSDKTLVEANRTLSEKMSTIRSQIAQYNVSLLIFDGLRNDFARRLAKMNAESIGSTNNFDCQSYTTEIAKYNGAVKQSIDMANDMTSDIFSYGKQINNLFNEAYYKWRYAFYRQYASAAKKDINALMDGLRSDLALDKILWKVADWWVSATINGLAGRLHTKYYFYSQPLGILTTERAKALSFKYQLTQITGSQKDAIELAIKSLDDKISQIDSSISFIQSRGWQGLLNLQTLSAKKRAELLPNNANCQAKTRVFLEAAAKVNSVESFDAASPLYKETVDVCIK